MNPPPPDDLSRFSLLELFHVESETQTALLTGGLLELERQSGEPANRRTGETATAADSPSHALLESLMRAAHSLKGAARIVGLDQAVQLAHALEDGFVAAQRGTLRLSPEALDILFRGVDLLQNIGRRSHGDLEAWTTAHQAEMQEFLDSLARVMGQFKANSQTPNAETTSAFRLPPSALASDVSPPPPEKAQGQTPNAEPPSAFSPQPSALPVLVPKDELPERVLRLTAENLNRLLGLAGESLVEARWLRPFAENMQRLKRFHADVGESFNGLRNVLSEHELPAPAARHLQDMAGQLNECRLFLNDRLGELELFDRRSAQLSHRLYLEVLRTRMRPFGDGARRLPRMVRDLARALGKEVRLEIVGENTQVDRDILEKLETPLAHLLRNAVDHGCEPPAVRRQLGKRLPATIRLEARHSAGALLVVVADDGAGVDPERIRETLVARRLSTPALAQRLGEAELLDFLFLPGFTLKDDVTEISGRGVGLDVVQDMVKTVRGSIRVASQPGRGTRFQLQLPLTLSVLRALLVEVGGEPYALPLAQIHRTLRLPRRAIEALEGRHHFRLDNESIGLLAAHQVFDCGAPDAFTESLPVVVLGDRTARYGLVVDRFLGERELVVQPLDPRLGKVKDISAAALMDDGRPVLIVDVEDTLRSVEKLIAEGNVLRVRRAGPDDARPRRKRVLAVDDSLTVRELERKLLASHGYEADVAVDGVEGWEAVRAGQYDLVIADVDMPRMDGIELTRLIKQDPKLGALPVLIVSYKDRDEDRLRGLEAGADYYLTKSSFHDEKLLQAVADLIGEAGT